MLISLIFKALTSLYSLHLHYISSYLYNQRDSSLFLATRLQKVMGLERRSNDTLYQYHKVETLLIQHSIQPGRGEQPSRFHSVDQTKY